MTRAHTGKLARFLEQLRKTLPRVSGIALASLGGLSALGFSVEDFGWPSWSALVACSIAALALSVATAAYQALRYVKIQVAQFAHVLPYVPLYVAKELGFFKAEGLDVTFKDTGGDVKTWDSVYSNESQIGLADPLAHLDDNAGDGVVIATVLARAVVWGLTLDRSLSLEGLPEGAHSIHSWAKDSTAYNVFSHYVAENHAAHSAQIMSRIKIIKVGTELASFRTNPNALILMTEPSASQAEVAGGFESFSAAQLLGDYLCTGLFVRRDWLKINHSEAIRFVAALQRAINFMHQNRGIVIDIAINEFSSTEPIVVLRAMTRMFTQEVFPKTVSVDQVAWANALRVRFGDRSAEFPFDDHVDVEVAKAARLRIENREKETKRARHLLQTKAQEVKIHTTTPRH